ncbi:MAG: MotA/TolQ/ExbB proton channel family protein [Candidatus Sericytochromatia bacterium]|nr:MotA/TolQ/ExbB proton channel family protein [Candidatus Sericytochromatia bacterium]
MGILLGWGGIIAGYVLDGGHLSALLVPTAAMIVFGGTFGTLFIAFPMKDVLLIPKLIGFTFSKNPLEPHAIIPQMIRYAEKARKDGLLALEADVQAAPDEFLKKGMQMVSDGIDIKTVREMLETELAFIATRHAGGIAMFEAAGGFAPTMGIIGTVMGMVHILGSLGGDSDPGALAPAIAVAFNATLYGVFSANLLWLPMGTKLKKRSEEEILVRELMLEGILSIQAGDNPQIVEEKLKGYLSPAVRATITKDD